MKNTTKLLTRILMVVLVVCATGLVACVEKPTEKALDKLELPTLKQGQVAVIIKNGESDNAPAGCSVVSTRISLGENVSGSIGVIGPVRMNYKKVVTVLDKISDLLIDIIK